MFSFLRKLLSPSRRKRIQANIVDILKENIDGLVATDIWKSLELETDNIKDPNYVPLAEVYSILVEMRDKEKLYNVSKMNIDEGRVAVYWRIR